MVQHPFVSVVWLHTSNTFPEPFKNLAVKMLTYRLPWWNKLFVDDFCTVHKANQCKNCFHLLHEKARLLLHDMNFCEWPLKVDLRKRNFLQCYHMKSCETSLINFWTDLLLPT